LHLAPLFRTLRIDLLHFELLPWREPAEMADEMNQMPARPSAFLGAIAPARHSGQPHAVLDDVEQLAVTELLGLGESQIRRARIRARTARSIFPCRPCVVRAPPAVWAAANRRKRRRRSAYSYRKSRRRNRAPR